MNTLSHSRTTLSNQLSDFSYVVPKITKEFFKNKHRRLSALFRVIRKDGSVRGIGDWPIMSLILQKIFKYHSPHRYELVHMAQQSKEYKELNRTDKIRFNKSLMDSVGY